MAYNAAPERRDFMIVVVNRDGERVDVLTNERTLAEAVDMRNGLMANDGIGLFAEYPHRRDVWDAEVVPMDSEQTGGHIKMNRSRDAVEFLRYVNTCLHLHEFDRRYEIHEISWHPADGYTIADKPAAEYLNEMYGISVSDERLNNRSTSRRFNVRGI